MRINYQNHAAADLEVDSNNKLCCTKHPWQGVVGVCSFCLQEKLQVIMEEASSTTDGYGDGDVCEIAPPQRPAQRTTLRSLFAMADLETASAATAEMDRSSISRIPQVSNPRNQNWDSPAAAPAAPNHQNNWANKRDLLWSSLLCKSKGNSDIISGRRSGAHHGEASKAEEQRRSNDIIEKRWRRRKIYERSVSSSSATAIATATTNYAATSLTTTMMQKSRSNGGNDRFHTGLSGGTAQFHDRFHTGPFHDRFHTGLTGVTAQFPDRFHTSAGVHPHHHYAPPPPPPPHPLPLLRFHLAPFRPSSSARPFTLAGRPSHRFLSSLLPHKLLAFL